MERYHKFNKNYSLRLMDRYIIYSIRYMFYIIQVLINLPRIHLDTRAYKYQNKESLGISKISNHLRQCYMSDSQHMAHKKKFIFVQKIHLDNLVNNLLSNKNNYCFHHFCNFDIDYDQVPYKNYKQDCIFNIDQLQSQDICLFRKNFDINYSQDKC